MFMFNVKVSGQNKNRHVIGYLLCRVMTGRHDVIEYMMQVLGHARCQRIRLPYEVVPTFRLRRVGPVRDGCQQVVSNQRRRALSGLAVERLAHVAGACVRAITGIRDISKHLISNTSNKY